MGFILNADIDPNASISHSKFYAYDIRDFINLLWKLDLSDIKYRQKLSGGYFDWDYGIADAIYTDKWYMALEHICITLKQYQTTLKVLGLLYKLDIIDLQDYEWAMSQIHYIDIDFGDTY